METQIQPVQAQDQKLTEPLTELNDIMNEGSTMFFGFESELNKTVAELF